MGRDNAEYGIGEILSRGMKKFSVEVSPELLELINSNAEKRNMSRSEYVRTLLGQLAQDDANRKGKGSELEIYGNILTETECDCGLRMYQDNRKVAPGSKPNRIPGFWCKICDSFGIED